MTKSGPGVQTLIKQMVLKEPSVSTDALINELTKKGFTPSKLTVSTIRTGFRQSIKIIQDAGYLKEIRKVQ